LGWVGGMEMQLWSPFGSGEWLGQEALPQQGNGGATGVLG